MAAAVVFALKRMLLPGADGRPAALAGLPVGRTGGQIDIRDLMKARLGPDPAGPGRAGIHLRRQIGELFARGDIKHRSRRAVRRRFRRTVRREIQRLLVKRQLALRKLLRREGRLFVRCLSAARFVFRLPHRPALLRQRRKRQQAQQHQRRQQHG